jgi:hypothetical protein
VIGDPEVADIKPVGRDGIELKGVRAGATSLLVWTATGTRHDCTILVRAPPKKSQASPAEP